MLDDLLDALAGTDDDALSAAQLALKTAWQSIRATQRRRPDSDYENFLVSLVEDVKSLHPDYV